MKVITVIGARPQFIKAAIVSRAIKKIGGVNEIIIHTGQHFDENMSEIFFEEMEIPKPNYNLEVKGLGHGAMTGQMLEKIEQVLIKEKPDWVLVYGDTNSTLAGALAAKKLQIKIAHVEAGLRSFNISMPEEINRIVTDRISDVLLCPTDAAMMNLKNEAYDRIGVRVLKVGDVMQDAATFYSKKAKKPLIDLPAKFALATVHRAENTDNDVALKNIFDALNDISLSTQIVIPLHPRTKSKFAEFGIDYLNSNIKFIDPVGYLEMVYLLKNCELVLTDSGGLQKEAYFFGKYCITMREETEWVELVDGGFNALCGSDSKKILAQYKKYKTLEFPKFSDGLYGNSKSGEVIVSELIKLNYGY